jgi:hypothetical protein
MTKAMTIYFDDAQTRIDFLKDISELIVWGDAQREESERRHYEDTVSYSFPDLESFDSDQPDANWNRLTVRQASIAIDPCHPAHTFGSN